MRSFPSSGKGRSEESGGFVFFQRSTGSSNGDDARVIGTLQGCPKARLEAKLVPTLSGKYFLSL